MTAKQELFIKNIAEACNKYREYGILPSLTIAQAIKESNWGESSLGAKYFNFFGMKWNKSCGCEYVELKTKEWNGKEYVSVIAKFRKYNSFEEGIKGYYDFLKSYKRYANLIGVTDSKTACELIAKDGWATSPTYGSSLYKDYVVTYNLTKYDSYNEVTPVVPVVPIANNKRIHKVVKGNTLWSLAEMYYGNGAEYRKIYKANNLTSTVIRIGQELIIP